MNLISNMFQNKTDRYLRVDKYFNPMYSPDSLIKLLKSPNQLKYLKKHLNAKTSNIFKLLKRLSVMSLLLIHSNKFYDLVSCITSIESGNKWIDQQFAQPYYRLLKKICASNQMYELVKRHSPLTGQKNMELLFYDISLLKMVFVIVQKMPLLGRYYKDKNQVATCNFINTLAVHAQRVYVSLRVLLCHIIENSKLYLPTREHQLIMKSILCQQLPAINQEMKKLFLDKYFYPLGKGIGLKLFKVQDQTAQTSKTINGIINDHQNTNRQKQKYQLEITLFPQPGRVNMKFYQQSLFASIENIEEKLFEEEVADIGMDQDQQKEKIGQEKTQKVNQNDIQTGIERDAQSLKDL